MFGTWKIEGKGKLNSSYFHCDFWMEKEKGEKNERQNKRENVYLMSGLRIPWKIG